MSLDNLSYEKLMPFINKHYDKPNPYGPDYESFYRLACCGSAVLDYEGAMVAQSHEASFGRGNSPLEIQSQMSILALVDDQRATQGQTSLTDPMDGNPNGHMEARYQDSVPSLENRYVNRDFNGHVKDDVGVPDTGSTPLPHESREGTVSSTSQTPTHASSETLHTRSSNPTRRLLRELEISRSPEPVLNGSCNGTTHIAPPENAAGTAASSPPKRRKPLPNHRPTHNATISQLDTSRAQIQVSATASPHDDEGRPSSQLSEANTSRASTTHAGPSQGLAEVREEGVPSSRSSEPRGGKYSAKTQKEFEAARDIWDRGDVQMEPCACCLSLQTRKLHPHYRPGKFDAHFPECRKLPAEERAKGGRKTCAYCTAKKESCDTPMGKIVRQAKKADRKKEKAEAEQEGKTRGTKRKREEEDEGVHASPAPSAAST